VDRDTLTGIILISLIMVVWMWWMSPPPPDTAEQTQQSQDTVVTDTQDQEVEAPTDTLTERAEAPQETPEDTTAEEPSLSLDAPQEGDGRTITIQTNLYEAQLSTKGATITSFILNEYRKFDQETPVQLIHNQEKGALALGFYSTANQLVDTRNLVFSASVDQDTLVLDDQPVELTFELPVGESGGIQQTYTFRPESYEVGLDVEYIDPGAFAETQGYELVWSGGIPFTEGNASTEAQASGVYARSGGEMTSITLYDQESEELSLSGSVEWSAVKNKFFTAVMIPETRTEGAELSGQRFGELESPDLWEDYTSRLLMPGMAQGGDSYRLYLGPMEYHRISAYDLGLYDMVDYGYAFLEWFTRPLATWVIIPSFQFLSTFIPSYGLIIIIFGILVKFLLYPLTKRSYESMAKMSDLQPKMQEIKEEYEDNPQKQQEAMMKMYKEAGVNPIGGCLPMLLQFPFIIALWRFFPNSISIRQQSFLWANDLSAPDVILNLPFEIPFYGDFVAGFTLLMGISMVFTMRIQSSGSAAGGQMKALQYIFPLMIFAIFNQFASGLSLYYLVYNIVTAGQQKYIKAQIADEEDDTPKTGKNIQRGRKKARQS
jgi:YidC/Oxa1 family membrane protein insertase